MVMQGVPIFQSIQAALTLADPRYYDETTTPASHPDPSGGAPARGDMAAAPQLAVDGLIQGERDRGFRAGGSLETPGPLLTHPHTVHMTYSEYLPTGLNPLMPERACFSQV
jgi:hypothetical protein